MGQEAPLLVLNTLATTICYSLLFQLEDTLMGCYLFICFMCFTKAITVNCGLVMVKQNFQYDCQAKELTSKFDKIYSKAS